MKEKSHICKPRENNRSKDVIFMQTIRFSNLFIYKTIKQFTHVIEDHLCMMIPFYYY